LSDPEHEALALRQASRQPEREARGSRRLRACARKHLMHRSKREPALQRGIDAGVAQRPALQQTFAAAGLQPLHFVPQGRKIPCVREGHSAPLLISSRANNRFQKTNL
jgi:hypothetical protein